jgi:hypothetical protein
MQRPLVFGCIAFVASIAAQVAAASAQSPAPIGPGDLSLEQQNKVGEILTRDAGTSVTGGRFSLAVGNAVPSEVQLRPVPATAAVVIPQFQGRSYVVVEEQIAVVDPQTRKILAVIQRGLSQTTGSSAPKRP